MRRPRRSLPQSTRRCEGSFLAVPQVKWADECAPSVGGGTGCSSHRFGDCVQSIGRSQPSRTVAHCTAAYSLSAHLRKGHLGSSGCDVDGKHVGLNKGLVAAQRDNRAGCFAAIARSNRRGYWTPFVSRTMRDTAADLYSIKIGNNLVNYDLIAPPRVRARRARLPGHHP